MAASIVDEGAQAEQDPLVAALPPATDYLTYLTLLEYQLKPSNLGTLNRLLCDDDGTLVEEIGWDLLRLVLPMLHETPQQASSCVQIIAKRGNPREVVLRVAEEFERLGRDDEEDDEDEEFEQEQADDETLPTFAGEAPRLHLGHLSLEGMPEAETEVEHESSGQPSNDAAAQKSLVFQELLGALSILHRRIKTKHPSRFLATSLPAALGAYRNLPTTIESTTAFLQCLDQLSSSYRPPLPPRASSVEVPGASQSSSTAPLPDPEAASEAQTGSNIASDNEKAIMKRLLQAVLVEIMDEYLSSLQDAEDPSMRWTCRLREKLEPRRSIPGKETERERWRKDSALRARDNLIGEFTNLSARLGLDPTKELTAAIEAPANDNEEESEYPTSPSQIPFAITGLVQLVAASAFTSDQASELKDLKIPLVFKSSQTLSEHAIIPLPSLQDALCSILYQQLTPPSDSKILESSTDVDFKTFIAMLTHSFTVGQDAQTRDDTHHVTTLLLHQRPSASDRMEIIKQTIRCTVESAEGPAITLCPPYLEGTLKAVGVDWLKDEILSHLSNATPDPSRTAPGLDPTVLENDSELAGMIAPDIPVLGTGGTVDPDTTTDILLSLPYYISILNLGCILFTRGSIHKDTETFKGVKRFLGSVDKWKRYLIEHMSVDEEVKESASDIFALEDACGRAEAAVVKRAREEMGEADRAV